MSFMPLCPSNSSIFLVKLLKTLLDVSLLARRVEGKPNCAQVVQLCDTINYHTFGLIIIKLFSLKRRVASAEF